MGINQLTNVFIVLFAVCEDGTYGLNCAYNCSGNCLNDYPCNKQNGHCGGGCKPGYIKDLCNERMLIFVTLSTVRKRFFYNVLNDSLFL